MQVNTFEKICAVLVLEESTSPSTDAINSSASESVGNLLYQAVGYHLVC